MRRRLLLVSPTFWPEPVGTPKYAMDAARWFDARGWAVAVVTAQPFYPDFALYDGWGPHRQRDQVGPIPIRRLPTIVPPGGKAIGRLASDLNFGMQAALKGALGTIPTPDAVLSFSPGVPFAVAAAGTFAPSAPHVSIVHDIQTGLAKATGLADNPAVLRAMGAIEARCLDRADHLLALSVAMADAVRDLGTTTPIDVARIWADIPIATTPPVSAGKSFTVTYSGNLGRKQGIPLLIDAAEVLAVKDPDIRLVIRGRGALGEWARTEADARRLTNLTFEDFVPEDQLAASLAEPDLHIVPQVSGSGAFAMPSKVVNILASGRPMLAVCDATDPLHGVTGEGLGLWAPADADAVAAAVLDARERDLTPIAKAGLDYVRRMHDRDVILSGIEALLIDGMVPR